jgi:hypothetical protein
MRSIAVPAGCREVVAGEERCIVLSPNNYWASKDTSYDDVVEY